MIIFSVLWKYLDLFNAAFAASEVMISRWAINMFFSLLVIQCTWKQLKYQKQRNEKENDSEIIITKTKSMM